MKSDGGGIWNTMQFETVLVANVPRVKYPDGHTELVSVPWATPWRSTLMFEGWAIAVLRATRTVSDGCVLLNLSWDTAQTIMAGPSSGASSDAKFKTSKGLASTKRASGADRTTFLCSPIWTTQGLSRWWRAATKALAVRCSKPLPPSSWKNSKPSQWISARACRCGARNGADRHRL